MRTFRAGHYNTIVKITQTAFTPLSATPASNFRLPVSLIRRIHSLTLYVLLNKILLISHFFSSYDQPVVNLQAHSFVSRETAVFACSQKYCVIWKFIRQRYGSFQSPQFLVIVFVGLLNSCCCFFNLPTRYGEGLYILRNVLESVTRSFTNEFQLQQV